MIVRITHLDGKLPNLALMKLSAWHKSKGDTVIFSKSITRELFEPQYDRVYGSAIFGWSKNSVEQFKSEWPSSIIGGTGTGQALTVEDFIGEKFESYDYEIYPWFKNSIGFSQRGCRLKCSFCVVPKKEGRVSGINKISEIWRGDPHPKKIQLLDNDFFGQSLWRERCEEIINGDFSICFNQGINARLIHKEGAEMLSKMKYRDDQFKSKRLYTAWDNKKDESVFFRGISILMDAGIRPQNIMVYMLCGYWPGETMEDVFFRFNKMKQIGLLPYPMVFDNSNKVLKKFQRWVIRRFHTFISWEDYLRGEIKHEENQQQLILDGTN